MRSKRVLLSVGTVLGLMVAGGLVYLAQNDESIIRVEAKNAPEQAEPVDINVIEVSPSATKNASTTSSTVRSRMQSRNRSLPLKLIWQQDFTTQQNEVPDARYWNIATESLPIYNNEKQLYSAKSENVRVANGRLILEAKKTPDGYRSGRIDTKGKIKIGINHRIEARIKLPRGQGVWPAFWLLSDNQPHTTRFNPTDADWQRRRFYLWNGEIDIMESYGTYPGVAEATVHTYSTSISNHINLPNASNTFHTYWLERYDDTLLFGVDDTTYHVYKKNGDASTWPFDASNQFYIILNLAMGGTGGGNIVETPGAVWRMEVESVAQYQL